MKCVPIKQLEPGQRLARPITNKDGAVLCPAGLTLSQIIINRLCTTGIDMAFIDSEDGEGKGAQERLAALQKRFEGVKDPALLELKKVIEAYFQRLG